MVDRVLSLLDRPGMRAVIAASVDWASAFSRTDPTITITKFINMGVRSSLVNILIEFLEDRQMSVSFNQETSGLYTLIGSGPQGSWTGQQCFLTASDDNASFVNQEDRYKYCDDLTIVELVMLGEILTQYDSLNNVYQRFLPTQRLESQKNLDRISSWTKENLMELNESKTNYLIFTRSNTPISTSLSINEKNNRKKKETKLLGVWLEEDGRWNKNTRELCKKGYARVSMITKLKYAGVSIEELIHNYKQFVRVVLEYCSVAWHSSLTERQAHSLERVQAVCLRIILEDNYVSYSAACKMTGLSTLAERRQSRCLDFGLKAIKHPENQSFFPENPIVNTQIATRDSEAYIVNFSRTEAYRKSAIPYVQRLLNKHVKEKEKEGGEGEGRGR